MDEYITVFTDMYGISEDDRGKAERCIESTIEYIKNYCHIDGIPDDLKHTVILMAADLFRYDVSASSGRYDNVTSIKEGDVTVHIDGEVQVVPAGTQVKLEPGMSITIMQGMYHDFEVEPGTGPVLIGEVSQCNDDNIDNRFNPPAGRFPEIEEDEPPYRLLCNEYPEAPEK